ncbi:MAG: carbamoyltransferase HypF [Candidatus Desulforudis sp.]|nr:carbamoyltransferase HypF [Desulforudis sp.]
MARGHRAAETVRYRITVRGTVQGVGFRPFVYNLAKSCGIHGSVLNAGRGVVVEAEGPRDVVDRFLETVRTSPPRLAQVEEVAWESLPPAGYTAFEIIASTGGEEIEALVPPDVGLCPDCARETFDPADRHHLYPFTNCTNCGPRFTIVRELPYDRPKTSMAAFPMCAECAREYHDPADRRFHAQPVACPVCGPAVELVDAQGRPVPGEWAEACWEILGQGGILALKSLGGFHLVCDARNPEALRELRRRKGRDAKPFAVMARNLATVGRYCRLDETEAELLASPQAPIVVLRRRPDAGLPAELAPGLQTLGVMLPYTPLHFLVFGGPFDLLVMTSGNYSELPLAKDNARALEELGGIADYFLRHNREIVNRCDDSLAAVMDGGVQLLRRSRGYVPGPVPVPTGDGPVVLGIGGEMKNTFCLLKKGRAFVSQHIGELDSIEGEENLFSSLLGFQRLLDIEAEIVGYDMHPDYRSSRLAEKMPARARFAVQHHHAHLAACLADNGLEERAIGVILDGTGYGPDGTLWGFEVLTGDYLDFTREIHLAPVPLPGGEAAVRHPWRTAVAYLLSYLGEEGAAAAERRFGDRGRELEVVQRMLTRGFNTPPSAGCGRLFDAVAALAGVCTRSTYEGQAAIELGELVLEDARGRELPPYSYSIKEGVISASGTIAGVVEDLERGAAAAVIATRFHNTVLEMVREAVRRVSAATGLETVALSGGTWQNRYLFQRARETLPAEGFRVLTHRRVPANDGGLCLGQSMIAYRRWKRCV